MTITRTMFTIAQAAAQCGVTTKTIQRRLPQLAELDAVKDEHGRWLIPFEALQQVGLQPGKPAGPDRVDSPTDTPSVSEQKVQDDVRAEIDRLNGEVLLLREVLAAKDQALASKDDALAAKDETLAWMRRQLPPGGTEPTEPAATQEPAADVVNGGAQEAATTTEPAVTEPVKRTGFFAWFRRASPQ